MRKGGALPCALNAADEIAVAAFLERRLPFLGIPEVIERVLARTPKTRFEKMDDVLTADREARRMAKEEVDRVAVAAAAGSEFTRREKQSPRVVTGACNRGGRERSGARVGAID